MKESYLLFVPLIIPIGKLLYLFYQKMLTAKANEEIADFGYNRYLELRNETFTLRYEDVGIVLPDDKEIAFALVMEIHRIDVLQAVAAFSDGKVWAFNSKNARKNIGDSNAVDLSSAAIEAVAAAQYHFARMRRNNAEGLLPGHIKFHILTNYDIYSAGLTIAEMVGESSDWLELVKKFFTVINEFNDAAESKPTKRIYTRMKVKRNRPANLLMYHPKIRNIVFYLQANSAFSQ